MSNVPITRFSSINLCVMLIELCDSLRNRYCIAAHSTLKGKLQFYFTDVITNDSVSREIEEIEIFAFTLQSCNFCSLSLEAMNTVQRNDFFKLVKKLCFKLHTCHV